MATSTGATGVSTITGAGATGACEISACSRKWHSDDVSICNNNKGTKNNRTTYLHNLEKFLFYYLGKKYFLLSSQLSMSYRNTISTLGDLPILS